MKMRFALILTAAVGMLVLGYTNCSRIGFKDDAANSPLRAQETIVGNPMTASGKTLLKQICQTITRCHSDLDEASCEAGVLASNGLDVQFGLPVGVYKTFAEILQAEFAGSFAANASATNSCAAALEKLSCSDPQVIGAYDKANGSFAGLPLLIPTSPGSCPVVFNQPPHRSEYFVSTTGSDSNDGSAERPWATITHASQALTPGTDGAIVHVAEGNYTIPATPSCASNSASCGVRTERSGTASAPITYISDRQWGAKLTAPGASITWYNSGDYVQIIGFEIVGTSSSNFGIMSEAAFGKIVGNDIHSIPVTTGCATNYSGGGIFFGYLNMAHDNDALSNRIHHIGPQSADGLAASAYCTGMILGIAYNQPRGKIQNNILFQIDGWGIGTWHMASDLQITNNLIFQAGHVTNTGAAVGGGLFMNGENNVGVHDRTTVANNIFRNIRGRAIAEWQNVGANNAYINNLVFGNTQNFDIQSTTVQGTISADPLMVGYDGSGTGNYKLKSTSPARDAGTLSCAGGSVTNVCTPSDDFAGFTRAYDASLDIGPYEWHP